MPDSGRQLLVEQPLHRFDQAFADLQGDVAGKTVAHDHIGLTRVHVAAFDVPDKPHRRRLEELVRIARQLVALAFLCPDRQQTDARRLTPQSHARIRRPHDRKLDEVLRPAFHGRARVQQHCRIPTGRDNRGERRPIDAGQPAERGMRGHDRRARVAGTEERRGLSIPDRLGRHANGSERLAPERGRGRFGHLDTVRRVEDAKVDGVRPGMPCQRVLDHLARAHEQKADPETPRSDQRPADDGVGRMVATHRVDGDSKHGCGELSAVSSQLSVRAFRAKSFD